MSKKMPASDKKAKLDGARENKKRRGLNEKKTSRR